MTNYVSDRKNRIRENEIRDLAVFGQLGGLIFVAVGVVRFMSSYTTVPIVVSKALMIVGGILILTGIICPTAISWFYKGFSFIGNGIGNFIFGVILSVVYIVLIIPAGLIFSRKRQDYLYLSWDDTYPLSDSIGFSERKTNLKQIHNGITGTLVSLFELLVEKGLYILIPIVIILIAVGIILFFVSSSVMAPFIYTLF